MILDPWPQPQLAAVRRISVKKSVEKAGHILYLLLLNLGICESVKFVTEVHICKQGWYHRYTSMYRPIPHLCI